MEAYENALDFVLYENGGILPRLAEQDARSRTTPQKIDPLAY
jgi:hypothetical protein